MRGKLRIFLKTMQTPLSPHKKQQLWRHYQAQKRKKLDPHLKRDLQHGWLFPYLTQTENLMWGRWQYWKECQMLPEVAWERWKWEQAIAIIENRKPEAIPKFVIEQTLPDREIPQISWGYNEQTEKMLLDCLDAIPVSGSWNCLSSWTYLRYFLHWLLFGLGHPGYKELPPEPQSCQGASMRLYQLFDISYLLMFPYDYFGRILPQISGKKTQQATGFFPTPMVVSDFMAKILSADNSHSKLDRIQTSQEPCVGTGSLLLTQSNHTLCAIGIDINRDLLECALFQFALYAPWYYFPIWWLGNTDLICGNSLTLENFESINTKFWLPIFADIVKVKLDPIDNETYQENLKQKLQKLNQKHQDSDVKSDIKTAANPLINKALYNTNSAPKVHQASLFDYLK